MVSGTLSETQVTRKKILLAIRDNPVSLSELRPIVLGENPPKELDTQYNWIFRAIVLEGLVRFGNPVQLLGRGHDIVNGLD